MNESERMLRSSADSPADGSNGCRRSAPADYSHSASQGVPVPMMEQGALRQQVLQIENLPPLPQTFLRLLSMLREERANARELEEAVRCDQALAARILRMANSAYYGFRGKIRSISRAIVALGHTEIRVMCFSSLLMDQLGGQDRAGRALQEGLWEHAFVTARLASEVARERPWISSEEAHLLGLLHDLGHFVVATQFPEQFREMKAYAEENGLSLHEAEPRFGFRHTQIGKWIAIKWGLPEVFEHVAMYHHTPAESPAHRPEVNLISLADTLARMSRDEAQPALSFDDVRECCYSLYVSSGEWDKFFERARILRHEALVYLNFLSQ